jgi:hypothetical protein
VMCSHFDPNWCPGESGQAQTISRKSEPDTRKGYHYISPVKSSSTEH